MRKEVKLALAIGGILVAVLIVYVMTVPPAGNKAANQPVALDTGSAKTEAQAKADLTQGGQKFTDLSKPSDAPLTVADSSTTKPSDPFAAKPADSGEDKWVMALNKGSVPMMTTSAPPAPNLNKPQIDIRAVSMPANSTANSTAARPISTETSPVPATQPQAATGVMNTHVVQAGESIAKIAEVAYGSQHYWPYIVRANPGIVANKLRPGMTLNMPTLAEVKGPPTVEPDTTKSGAVIPSDPSVKIDPATQYEVQPGDSLNKIAMKLYGNSNKWQAIYDLNKDAIGADPAKLKMKSVLKLPEPPTQK